MLDLPFDPELVLGPLRIAWHSVFALAGMIVGAAVGIRCARPWLTWADGYLVAVAGIGGGLVGARLFHVIDQWQLYGGDPLAALQIWAGGSSIVGGIAGGVVAGAFTIRRLRIPLAPALDGTIVGLPLGMAIGRIGDIINGEHHATACAGLPWCVRYTAPATLGQRDYVHPAVAYELLLDLAIVAVLLYLLPRAERLGLRGRLAFVFVGLYGVARLALGAIRLDPVFVLGISQADLVALAFIALALPVILWSYRGRLLRSRQAK